MHRKCKTRTSLAIHHRAVNLSDILKLSLKPRSFPLPPSGSAMQAPQPFSVALVSLNTPCKPYIYHRWQYCRYHTTFPPIYYCRSRIHSEIRPLSRLVCRRLRKRDGESTDRQNQLERTSGGYRCLLSAFRKQEAKWMQGTDVSS